MISHMIKVALQVGPFVTMAENGGTSGGAATVDDASVNEVCDLCKDAPEGVRWRDCSRCRCLISRVDGEHTASGCWKCGYCCGSCE